MRSESMSETFLRYLGTSHRLEDETTGLVWERNGEAVGVSKDDAARLLATSPYDLWDVVSPEGKREEDVVAQQRATAAAAAAQAAYEELKAEAAESPEPVVHPAEVASPPAKVKAPSADSTQDGDNQNATSQEASK